MIADRHALCTWAGAWAPGGILIVHNMTPGRHCLGTSLPARGGAPAPAEGPQLARAGRPRPFGRRGPRRVIMAAVALGAMWRDGLRVRPP